MSTLRRRVRVGVGEGAHARPVAELARLAQTHGAAVVVRTAAGSSADVTSVLAVMDLAIGSGDEVTFETEESPGAAALLEALAAVLDPI